MSNLLSASRALLKSLDGNAPIVAGSPPVKVFRRAVEDAEKVDAQRDLLERLGNPTLTPTQLDIVCLIDRYIRENNVSPTLQELADMRGVSKVTLFGQVNDLEKKNVVTRSKHMARSIRLIFKDENAAMDALECAKEN